MTGARDGERRKGHDDGYAASGTLRADGFPLGQQVACISRERCYSASLT